MFIILFLVLILGVLVSTSSSNGDGEDRFSYAVALTTIPPRFQTVHHTVLSWIKQDIPPQRIVIFIPRRYKRFKSRTSLPPSVGYKSQLLLHLHRANLTEHIESQTIQIVEATEDWGPITKFVGSAMYASLSYTPPYWIYCDDDVAYKPELSTHYSALLHNSAQLLQHYEVAHSTEEQPLMQQGKRQTQQELALFGFTMFAAEHRIHVQPTRRKPAKGVPHIQGVDTYIVPNSIFGNPLDNALGQSTTADSVGSISREEKILRVIKHFHTQYCPESFYQDDYLVSYILHLLGVRMYSARYHNLQCALDIYSGKTNSAEQIANAAGDTVSDIITSNFPGSDCTTVLNMVDNIEGVSKVNFQMHMKEEVFTREFVTQQCLTAYASEAYNMLHSEVG